MKQAVIGVFNFQMIHVETCMHKLFMVLAAASACCMFMTGCGSSSKVQPQSATGATETPAPESKVDCDAFMHQLAEGCYAVTVFEEDGVTPIHVYDEANNDLGEVDQEWAASYCECYAQLAFQSFGCSGVLAHEELDDATYATTYEPIVATCAGDLMPSEETSAPVPANQDGDDAGTAGEYPEDTP